MQAGNDHGDAEDSMLDKTTVKPGRTGIFQSCAWFNENKLRRWQFALFLLFGVATLLWLILRVTGSLTGDVLAGLSAIVLAVYGASHFRTLLGLKEQVDKFSRNNRAFKQENAAIKMEVDKLGKAREQLGATADQLKETTQGYKENIAKFKVIDEKLGKLADDNIEGLEKLQQMTKTVNDSIEKELIQHQRDILMRVQESMEITDDTDGLTEDEYNQFIGALPVTFQNRFTEMDRSFADMAGADGKIDMDEFTEICDQFAKQEATALN
eukprot:223394_1